MAKKDYVVGTGNVFEGLGHLRPAEALAKAELVRKIGALIGRRRVTQAGGGGGAADRSAENLGSRARRLAGFSWAAWSGSWCYAGATLRSS